MQQPMNYCIINTDSRVQINQMFYDLDWVMCNSNLYLVSGREVIIVHGLHYLNTLHAKGVSRQQVKNVTK